MTEPSPTTAPTTAGALLREAREKQGIHIGALAAAIKVTPRKLDALENDRWHELPDATFARALAQTVCRTLKIDAAPVLELLPTTGQVALEPVSNANHQPFRDRPGRSDTGFAGQAIRPMLWAASALMLAAVAVYFVPPDLLSSAQGVAQAPAREPGVPPALPITEPPPADVVSAPAPVDTAALPGVSVAGATTVSTGGLPAASLPLDAQPAPAPVPAAAVSTPAAPSPAVPAAAAVAPPAAAPAPLAAGQAAPPAAAQGSRLLQLSSSAPSWVEVRDGAGELLLSRTLLPGEVVGVDGALPLRLTIGNAAATQVAFRGQPVDLAARTRENVARFEVQ